MKIAGGSLLPTGIFYGFLWGDSRARGNAKHFRVYAACSCFLNFCPKQILLPLLLSRYLSRSVLYSTIYGLIRGGSVMRIKKGFVLREVAGQNMVIATGEASKDFHGMIKLNSTGRDIWQGLQEGLSEVEIAKGLEEKYHIDEQKALMDTKEFVNKMLEMGFVVNE